MVVDGTNPDGANPGRAGDLPAVESFAAFYEAHYRPAVRLSAALVGRWDLAEELVQDAFVAMHGRWEHVSQYDAPEAWLRRVVLNRSLSSLRRRTTEVRLIGRLSRQRERNVESPAPESEIWKAVAALPKRQAQVMALMFIDDLSSAEIASVLECDENTVRTHYRRARLSLAARFGVEEEGS
jgi:RNA polymerase sigma factor (sigma-70 family)